jgi:hypothetical protein
MKKKIYYIGCIGDRDFYFYKSYTPKLLHRDDSRVFNTLREAKAWAIACYQCDLDDIKGRIADLRQTKKNDVMWESEIDFQEEDIGEKEEW